MSWEQLTLGELVKGFGGLIQTGPFGAQLKQSEYTDEGVPVIMPTNISDGRINVGSIARVLESTAVRLARHRIKPDTIVFPRRGEITKRAYITEEQSGWLCGTGCLKIEAPENVIFPKFLYYQMGTADSVDWLQKNAVGATMLNLSGEILARYPVRFPDLSTQQRIASILSAYDDLIENNRRRIVLLEQAARLLYREWFVHFRFPGHETVKIIDGLPEGWSRVRLSDVCSTNKKSHKTGKLPTWIRYTDIGSVSTGRINQATVMSAEEAPGRARRIAEDGDTIWSNVRPNLRAYALVTAPQPEDVFSTGFTVLHAEAVSPYFLYLTVTTDDFVKYLENHATGVGYPAVRSNDFERAIIVKPSDSLMVNFHQLCQSMFAEQQKLFDQNAQLTRARDLLLPRLMDGRIAV